MSDDRSSPVLLRKASWLSFWIGVLMLFIKMAAWWQTRSSAILSDAAESVVHVAAVAFVVYSLRLSQKPPDEDHPYGHAKISFFSAGFEGGLISVAGIFILIKAALQWNAGEQPHDLEFGSALIAASLFINGWLGWYLIQLGKRNGSLILESNGMHVLVDAWTSLGVLVGLLLTWLTDWAWLDPLCAIFVALHILRNGVKLLWQSANGLMDRADPAVKEEVVASLDASTKQFGITWHHLRHRHLGDGHWVDFHLVFEDDTSVKEAHDIATRIERSVRATLGPGTTVTSHLEPAEDHERIHGHAPGELEP
ncbi:MAG: cation diffusion facilitator family transporter [Verrucomicrobiales bacterium]|nr:cation diffusion facilitator family transporter [Verrucomicrobiales bacterium]